MAIRHINFFMVSTFMFSFSGSAQPSLQSAFMLGDERLYKDIKKSNLYYYMPFDYKLVTDASGKPSFTLTQMRYTGTQSTGDANVVIYNNLLQFKVAVDAEKQNKITALKKMLKTTNAASELQMLPVRNFSSVLVFASSGDVAAASGDSVNLVKVNLTEATDENAAANNSYWNERTVSLRLSNADAELVTSALNNNQSVMSFSYAIYTVFAEKTSPDIVISGQGKLRKETADYFQQLINPSRDTAMHIAAVKADAIPLDVDVKKWPSVIQQVDINERLPAKYAVFDVYCYDFNNELRPDLFEKRIEIKAMSVTGNEISAGYSFKKSKPDVYARSIRFAYAVKFNQPFKYRVTEINNDGETEVSPWMTKKEWSEILDITSPPEKIIQKPKETEQ